MEMVIELLKIILIVLVAANAMTSRAQTRLFMVFYLGCFAFFPVRGTLSNYFLYGHTEQGRAVWNLMYSNPNDLAAMCLLQLSMAVALLAIEPRGWVRLCAGLGVFVLPMVILLTQSRGVFLGLLVFLAITFTGQKRRLLLAFRLCVLLVVMAALAPSSVWTRLESLQHATSTSTLEEVDGAEGSALQRYVIWQVALKIIRENPITGVGIGSYERTHAIYSMSSEFNPTARGPRDTHSLYLNVLAETGYLGFFLYVGMLVSIAVAAEKTRRRCKGVSETGARQLLALEAGFAGFMVATIFSSMPYLPHFLLHLVVLYAWTTVYKKELSEPRGQPMPVTTGGRPAGRGGGYLIPQPQPAGLTETLSPAHPEPRPA
jgi:O-antigen ligase